MCLSEFNYKRAAVFFSEQQKIAQIFLQQTSIYRGQKIIIVKNYKISVCTVIRKYFKVHCVEMSFYITFTGHPETIDVLYMY